MEEDVVGNYLCTGPAVDRPVAGLNWKFCGWFIWLTVDY